MIEIEKFKYDHSLVYKLEAEKEAYLNLLYQKPDDDEDAERLSRLAYNK